MKGNKKRLSINLSFFAPNDQTTTKSTKSPKKLFQEPNGVVGLGIVAAMTELDPTHDPFSPTKTNPIPIIGKFSGAAKFSGGGGGESLSEDYTCVISNVGGNLVKREYFEGGFEVFSCAAVSGGEVVAPAPVGDVFGYEGFLSSCYLCKKKLHGLDIFMYRGEKAFCSTECRYQQISIDERKEKCGSMKPLEYSVSPCSGPMQFFAGVAAA